MRADRRSRFVPVAALAGVVIGHWIAYRLEFPSASARGTALAGAGHGYWFGAVVLAVIAATLAGSGTIVRHAGRVLRSPHGPPDPVRSSAIRLAALQTSLFLVQEVLERVRVGESLSSLGRGGFLLVGVAIQVVVALAIALVLALLGRTAAAVVRAIIRRPRSRAADRHRLARHSFAPIQRTGPAPFGPRAPPLPLAA